MKIEFTVFDEPKPQGSKKGFAYKDKKTGRILATVSEDNEKLMPWRQAVIHTTREAMRQYLIENPAAVFPIDGPIAFGVIYRMPRPKSHHTPKGNVSSSWRHWHTVTPDMDKLDRALWDALKIAGLIADDSNICKRIIGEKIYSDSRIGAQIIVEKIETEGRDAD